MKKFCKKHIDLILALTKILVLVIVLFVSFGMILGISTATNEYMNPGVKYHDNVIYARMAYSLVLRDVVVYTYTNPETNEKEEHIGRIVGMPGDTISTLSNGNYFQNNNLIYETNIQYTTNRSMEVEITLKENEYFILNDDRSQNFDSRTYGAINEDDIKGKVIAVFRRYGI